MAEPRLTGFRTEAFRFEELDARNAAQEIHPLVVIVDSRKIGGNSRNVMEKSQENWRIP